MVLTVEGTESPGCGDEDGPVKLMNYFFLMCRIVMLLLVIIAVFTRIHFSIWIQSGSNPVKNARVNRPYDKWLTAMLMQSTVGSVSD